MTISSTTRKAGPFIGNGTTTAFPFAYKVFQASDLLVVRLDTTLNIEHELTLNTDYTVTLNLDQDSNPGGTVNLLAALATGYTLTLTSDLPNLQPTDLTNQGGFYPDVINDALDRATIQIQQLQEQTDRSLKVAVSSTADSTLPPPAPNDLIGWDATGENLINVDPGSIATVVAYATAYADVFIGNGITTSWTLTRDPAVLYNLDVSINGSTQEPTRDYTLSGTTFTMTTPPPIGARVVVKYKEGLPNYAGDSQDVRFVPGLAGSATRSVQSKLRDFVSVLDFMTAAQINDVVSNLGSIDVTAAIQTALNASKNVYFPAGTYLVSDTVKKDVPRPTLNRIYGAGKYVTTIKASATMTNKPMFHFGDTSGHGAPQVELIDIGFDGHDMANGNSGVFLQEGGICHLANIKATNCAVGIDGTGATDTLIDGDNFISSCGIGVRMLWAAGIGPSNEVRIRNVWFTACNQAVYGEGDFIEISGCTAQSVGLDGTKHVFEVNNSAHIGFTFFGANIFNNWVEGGFNKYCVAVIGTASPIIYNNILIGQGGVPQADREGAILVDTCGNANVNTNSVYQFFTRTPQDGRLANAAIYIRNSANTGKNWRTWHNTIYRSQNGNQYYFEGLPEPTMSKDGYQSIWGVVTISGGVGTVASGKNIDSAVRYGGAGYWQVNFPYNRESLNSPVFIQPAHSTALFSSYTNNGANSIRIRFFDAAGTAVDPDVGFSIMCLTEQNQN